VRETKPTARKKTASASPDRIVQRERITLLSGGNAPAKSERLARLTERWLDGDWKDFNYSEVEARESNANDLLTALAQVSMGDPDKHRVIVIRGVDRLRANEAEALAAILPRAPAEARLILVAEGDKSGRDSKLSSRLLKVAEAEGQVFDFPSLRSGEAVGFVQARAKERGLRLSSDAPRALAAKIGADAAVLDRELEKLAAAVEPNEIITGALIAELTPASVESNVFELTDAVGERNAQKALEAMQSLLATGQTAYLLLPMVARQLRLIWQMKAEREGRADSGLKDPGIARLGDWQRQKLQRQAQAFTWAALEEGLAALFETDLALKGIEEGGENPQALLETLLLRLCGVSGGQRLVVSLH
jgi:DNA polymerase-3 subunit delta